MICLSWFKSIVQTTDTGLLDGMWRQIPKPNIRIDHSFSFAFLKKLSCFLNENFKNQKTNLFSYIFTFVFYYATS